MARKEFNLTVGTVQLVATGNHWSHEASVGVALVTIDMSAQPINAIVYLINEDAVNDLFVAFDAAIPTAAIANGANGTIRLKPGESLADMQRSTQKIKLIRAAGSGNVRFMGV